jgi:hypothetical protein
MVEVGFKKTPTKSWEAVLVKNSLYLRLAASLKSPEWQPHLSRKF